MPPQTIPIVMIGVSDPVASGLVASLGRPGGNVTGTSAVAAGVVGKQLELLRDLLPGSLGLPCSGIRPMQSFNSSI